MSNHRDHLARGLFFLIFLKYSTILYVTSVQHSDSQLLKVVLSGFPGSSAGKESACNMGDLGLIPGWGRSLGGGHGNPLQHSCLENPHGQRSVAGYSPQDCKVSDTSEVTEHTQVLRTFLIL